jgi:alanyl-tRNA synthetase
MNCTPRKHGTNFLARFILKLHEVTFNDEFASSSLLTEILKLCRYSRPEFAFELYDTYGFPLDLTELMARERGLTVDTDGFEKLMEEQRARARAAQKKEVISLSQIETTTPTNSSATRTLRWRPKCLEVVSLKDKTAVILDTSACYAEMGGQVGDTGELTGSGQLWRVTNTQKIRQHIPAFRRGRRRPGRRLAGVTLDRRDKSRVAMPSSVITPSRICSTGPCTKSPARKLRRKARSSARTN